jgi:hypothetical protein
MIGVLYQYSDIQALKEELSAFGVFYWEGDSHRVAKLKSKMPIVGESVR